MSAFSDDDMERLKEYGNFLTDQGLPALLTRLEAAEKVCSEYENSLHPAQGTPMVITAWRKSKGEQCHLPRTI